VIADKSPVHPTPEPEIDIHTVERAVESAA
jgi:hypothetical protein